MLSVVTGGGAIHDSLILVFLQIDLFGVFCNSDFYIAMMTSFVTFDGQGYRMNAEFLEGKANVTHYQREWCCYLQVIKG